ncbi:unnamed protein product, partial [Adineta steineri]
YTNSDRSTTSTTTAAKRIPNGHHPTNTKNTNGIRTRNGNGSIVDTENDENMTISDNYQPKIIDNKTRTLIPVHRYPTNNNIQTSASTSSVTNTMSRTKVPVSTAANLYRRDLNASGTDVGVL